MGLGFVALGFDCFRVFFVQDVGELGGVEDLAAELTLNKLDVLLAGDDADLGMFARCGHREAVWMKVCLRPNGLSTAKFGGESLVEENDTGCAAASVAVH